ncbi:MAG: hypothetical protein BroJett040_01670 [Oligoflexia bacterium]|nr:MAG: hypothetical protein BroJett040_01670 [Oligoflexia bacterium]
MIVDTEHAKYKVVYLDSVDEKFFELIKELPLRLYQPNGEHPDVEEFLASPTLEKKIQVMQNQILEKYECFYKLVDTAEFLEKFPNIKVEKYIALCIDSLDSPFITVDHLGVMRRPVRVI